MVSKLIENGVAGFILANGALSGGGEEYKIRKKLIENNLVEAILVLPQNMFYTTDISVTLWILNNNKKEQSKKVSDKHETTVTVKMKFCLWICGKWAYHLKRNILNFLKTILKKYVQYLSRLATNRLKNYENIPEFCYSATFEEVKKRLFTGAEQIH